MRLSPLTWFSIIKNDISYVLDNKLQFTNPVQSRTLKHKSLMGKLYDTLKMPQNIIESESQENVIYSQTYCTTIGKEKVNYKVHADIFPTN